jgi:hypothetical protein
MIYIYSVYKTQICKGSYRPIGNHNDYHEPTYTNIPGINTFEKVEQFIAIIKS